MAVYTTLFLCKPDELLGGFPGWRLPLPQPIRRELRNPLTGKLYVVETREPVWSEGPDEEPNRVYKAVVIKGRYADHLEGRLPAFVRARPHWAAKGLTGLELEPLFQAIGVEASLEHAIYSPPSSGAVIQQLPPEFLAKFGSLDQQAIAKQWAAAMSAPEHTYPATGEKLSDEWTTNEALGILEPIVTLGRKATAGQQMYLLTEV